MFKRLTNFVGNHTKKRNIFFLIAGLVCAEALFNIFLPSFIEKTGTTIIDMSPAISVEETYSRLANITKAKHEYICIRFIDLIFPVIYSLAFSFISCSIYRKKYQTIENYRWVLIVPFIAAISDYLENFLLIFLQVILPTKIPLLVFILNFFILFKFISISISILLIITGLLSLLKGGDSSLLIGNKFKGPNKKNIEK